MFEETYSYDEALTDILMSPDPYIKKMAKLRIKLEDNKKATKYEDIKKITWKNFIHDEQLNDGGLILGYTNITEYEIASLISFDAVRAMFFEISKLLWSQERGYPYYSPSYLEEQLIKLRKFVKEYKKPVYTNGAKPSVPNILQASEFHKKFIPLLKELLIQDNSISEPLIKSILENSYDYVYTLADKNLVCIDKNTFTLKCNVFKKYEDELIFSIDTLQNLARDLSEIYGYID